jgi:hypothetical protein
MMLIGSLGELTAEVDATRIEKFEISPPVVPDAAMKKSKRTAAKFRHTPTSLPLTMSNTPHREAPIAAFAPPPLIDSNGYTKRGGHTTARIAVAATTSGSTMSSSSSNNDTVPFETLSDHYGVGCTLSCPNSFSQQTESERLARERLNIGPATRPPPRPCTYLFVPRLDGFAASLIIIMIVTRSFSIQFGVVTTLILALIMSSM